MKGIAGYMFVVLFVFFFVASGWDAAIRMRKHTTYRWIWRIIIFGIETKWVYLTFSQSHLAFSKTIDWFRQPKMHFTDALSIIRVVYDIRMYTLISHQIDPVKCSSSMHRMRFSERKDFFFRFRFIGFYYHKSSVGVKNSMFLNTSSVSQS